MSEPSVCLVYGFIISLIVSGLKAVPVVKQYPKIVVFVLTTAGAALGIFLDGMQEWQTLIGCVVAQFAAAVTTHEAVVHPVVKRLQDDA